MKKSEKRLLDSLKEQPDNNNVLATIYKAMGKNANAFGNPLLRAELGLNITTQFFDNLTNPVAPGGLPAQLQTFLPIYLFGLTDYMSGYPRSLQITPPNNPWAIGGAFGVFGLDTGAVFLGAAQFQRGDFVLQYLATVAGNVWTCTVRISCSNVAYGTFLNSFVSDIIVLNLVKIIVPVANVNQLDNPINIGYQTLFGKLATDSIDPNVFITNKTFNPNISDIPIDLPIDKNLMLGFRLNFDCQNVNIILGVQKVEPLTKVIKRLS